MRKKIVGFRKYSEGGHREIDKNKDKGKGIYSLLTCFMITILRVTLQKRIT